MRTAVIVNPKSANGRTGRDWRRIEPEVHAACAPDAILHTEHVGHAVALTRELLTEGYTQIVSAGGDGTHHEVVNGFFRDERIVNPAARMAILPQGTGSDLARSLHLRTLPDALAALRTGTVRTVDVGLAWFKDHHGDDAHEYFLNCAHIGFGGHVADRVNRTSKALGGFASFLLGVLRGLATYRCPIMTVSVGNHCISGRIHDVVIANAQWDGGGMFIAPNAALDSGTFEVYVIDELGVFAALRNLHKVYKGRLMDRPDIVQHFRATSIEAHSAEQVLINLEGEQPGRLPASFQILPGILSLVTGAAAIGRDMEE